MSWRPRQGGPCSIGTGGAASGRRRSAGVFPAGTAQGGGRVVRHHRGENTALLVFEDLHWGDTESVKVFGRLGTASGLRLLPSAAPNGSIAATPWRRPRAIGAGSVAAPPHAAKAHHGGGGRTPRRRLPAADPDAGGERAPPTHRRKPLLPRGVGHGGRQLPPEELPDVQLPWNLSEAVLRHLGALDPDQLSVLESAAVAGQRSPSTCCSR